ncbi:MAG: PP2C family protein-serine/threonine phosphatase [Anaerolineae bacterium]|nr:PP2C family protein-serine/threonine phosphatase [Anaerolineae bacterium]
MAGSEALALHRVIDRRKAEELLHAFAGLHSGMALALARPNGKIFAGAELWRPESIVAHVLASTEGQPIHAPDMHLYPLRLDGHLVGALVASVQAPPSALDTLHRVLRLILSDARDRRQLASETLERYNEINLLYQLGATIGSVLDLADIAPTVLKEALVASHASLTAVLLRDPADPDAELVVLASQGNGHHIENMVALANPRLPALAETDEADILMPDPDEGLPLEAILCAPMKMKGVDILRGAILLGRLPGEPMFTAGDGKLVMAIARQAAIAVERALYFQREIERQRLEEELAVGRRIQLSLLPAAVPQIAGWEFAAIYEAAGQVGGDLYDFFELPGDKHRLGLVIADVTGKGIPAALFMAFSRTVLRSVSMTGKNPAEVLQTTNRLIINESRSELFLTAFYATLETGSGELAYANGGHGWPLWLHASTGRCEDLAARSFVIGAVNEITLEEREVQIEPGDLLVFTTDGVTESKNVVGEMFGEERLRAVVEANMRGSADAMLRAIVEAVRAFVGEAPLDDDFTLYVVKRQAQQPDPNPS